MGKTPTRSPQTVVGVLPRGIYRKVSNIRRTKSQHLNDSHLVLQSSLSNPLKPGVKLREWRCSWSSADRRCSNYIWVINNIIAYKGAPYIRDLAVVLNKHTIVVTYQWNEIVGKIKKNKIFWGKIIVTSESNNKKYSRIIVPMHKKSERFDENKYRGVIISSFFYASSVNESIKSMSNSHEWWINQCCLQNQTGSDTTRHALYKTYWTVSVILKSHSCMPLHSPQLPIKVYTMLVPIFAKRWVFLHGRCEFAKSRKKGLFPGKGPRNF